MATRQTIEVTYYTAARECECSCGFADGGHVGQIRSGESRAMRAHLTAAHGLTDDEAAARVRRAMAS